MLLLCQTNDPVTNICHAADKQLFTLVEWAKRIPHFSDLTLEDQVILLRAGNVPDAWPLGLFLVIPILPLASVSPRGTGGDPELAG